MNPTLLMTKVQSATRISPTDSPLLNLPRLNYISPQDGEAKALEMKLEASLY